MSCPCCSSDQPLEPGNPTNFLSNREMLEKIADFRQQPGNKTKALKNLVCGGNKVGGVGGQDCREEGGCLTSNFQCPMFAVTSPWYRAHLPFLKPPMSIKNLMESLVKKKANLQKDEKKTSGPAVSKRKEFNIFLDQTFKVFTEDIHNRVKSCPTR